MTKVSIVTPLYNCSDYLEQTIQSILYQTYQNWEMIMVDDCSKDNSIEIAQKYVAQDNRIKLIKLEQNSGAAVARNIAIEESKGRYIAFLDADDIWKPVKVEK
jgi:glycosyltransferase involved in cell wall biosynthesis